jgi:ABC-2 type transport system ATP-binding protein
MHAIEITHLTKRFGAVTAVDDLSFAADFGAVTGFLGPNGSGKTTTLRALLGLVAPDSGSATVTGARYDRLEHPARTVGAVLDAAGAHPSRTARDHLRVHALAAGIGEHRVDEVLSLVDLVPAAGRRVGGFSLGMRQRLHVATALLGDPQVLVLDEPTNGLDPAGVRWLRDLLRQLAADGRAVIVSSHLLAEVARTVDHVVIIERGRLVRSAPLVDLVGPQGVAVRSEDAARLRAVLAGAGLSLAPPESDRDDVVLALDTTPEAVGRVVAAAAVAVYELRAVGGSLEDTFLSLTAHDLSVTSHAPTTTDHPEVLR